MIKVLDADAARSTLPALAEILTDCVNGGASVGFMEPFSSGDALPYWSRVASEVEAGNTVLLAAEHQGQIVGTVQLGMAQMPNQPHRADLKKLLVHRNARGLGLARQLMQNAETEARKRGKTLLCLDTATGSPAEAIYAHLGWQKAGIIPNYALFPDGSYCATTFFYRDI
ncbi:N-acetyltransferase [Phyllobacterium salinisoli]|uniref:N-acetyltransferase n=1 Tax=Phyllobacterium salinisoli TaxID=1899321 RepID=A0A368K3J9_9HYPH|nr:GNAT family N-acetyltransferase [Phyllobacterium salinisoli]RCS23764.1 N-acetyltransferase [Phyllobacterium salinisoli]